MRPSWVVAVVVVSLATFALLSLSPTTVGAQVQLQPRALIPADASYLAFGRNAIPEAPGEAVHTRLDVVWFKFRPTKQATGFDHFDSDMLIVMMSQADYSKLNPWAKAGYEVSFRISRDKKTVTLVYFNADHDYGVNHGKPDYVVLDFVSAEHWKW